MLIKTGAALIKFLNISQLVFTEGFMKSVKQIFNFALFSSVLFINLNSFALDTANSLLENGSGSFEPVKSARSTVTLKSPRKSSVFAGKWYSRMKLINNTCSSSVPSSLNIGLNISSSHVGTDIGDGSPFFTGRVLAKDRIGFARRRSYQGCTQSQALILSKVNGKTGSFLVESTTSCPTASCKTLFTGSALKR